MAGVFDDESLQFLVELNSEDASVSAQTESSKNEPDFDSESEEYLKTLTESIEPSKSVPVFDCESLEYLKFITKNLDVSDSDDDASETAEAAAGDKTEDVEDAFKVFGEDDEAAEVTGNEALLVTTEEGPPLLFIPNREICSQYCSSKCTSVWNTWTKDEKLIVESVLPGKSVLERKNYLLEHLKKQKEFGLRRSGFHFNGHTFCLKSFSQFSGISDYLLKQVIKDHHSGLFRYVHGNESGTRMTSATINFIVWMKQFGQQYGQFSPDQLVTVIPAHWTRLSIYKKYLSEIVGQVIKQSTFYTLLVSKFGHARADKTLPWLRISSYSTHSICDTCLALDQYRRNCTTKDQITYVQALSYKHKEAYGRSRIALAGLRQTALSFPADVMMIMLDDMDNQKSFVPRILERGKKLSGLNTLPSKITGTITWSGHYEGGRRIKFFINHNQFQQNGNKSISVIFLLLQDFVKEFKKLPKTLVVNCDNCWRKGFSHSGIVLVLLVLPLKFIMPPP